MVLGIAVCRYDRCPCLVGATCAPVSPARFSGVAAQGKGFRSLDTHAADSGPRHKCGWIVAAQLSSKAYTTALLMLWACPIHTGSGDNHSVQRDAPDAA